MSTWTCPETSSSLQERERAKAPPHPHRPHNFQSVSALWLQEPRLEFSWNATERAVRTAFSLLQRSLNGELEMVKEAATVFFSVSLNDARRKIKPSGALL